MFEIPKWKIGLVVSLILLAFLYALPNAFPGQPAVQISANRGEVVNDLLQGRVEGTLKGKKIAYDSIALANDRLILRFGDGDTQLAAHTALVEELGIEKFTIALDTASTVPAWLNALRAKPMVLGLDLRGGIHFLMQVDQQAARDKLDEGYIEGLYVMMRSEKIAYRAVTRNRDGFTVELASREDREKAFTELVEQVPDLIVTRRDNSETVLDAVIRPEKVAEAQRATIEQNITTLRNRINELGVAEPIIQQQGATRIVVQLPGVQDPTKAKTILGATATLEYRAINDSVNPVEVAQTGRVPADSLLFYDREGNPVVVRREVIATGDQLTGATSGLDPESGTPSVNVSLDAAGGRRMLDFTQDNVGRPMAVIYIERVPEVKIVDGKEVRTSRETKEVINQASIRGVFGPNFQTTGLASTQEASELALLLRAGSLAVPVDIIEERVIGPSLGAENIKRGLEAMLIGSALIALFVMVYYRLVGVVTVVGLVVNLLLLVAVLSFLGATLTMPGIAGIVLTIGMAVDANVLIAERIREEVRAGNTPLAALRAGYEKAWGTILDANLTTMFAALAMFAFGSGPVRGFAVTLFAGLITSMFSAVVVTQLIMAMIYNRKRKVAAISV
jgi:preprotein translocase subunit SecD